MGCEAERAAALAWRSSWTFVGQIPFRSSEGGTRLWINGCGSRGIAVPSVLHVANLSTDNLLHFSSESRLRKGCVDDVPNAVEQMSWSCGLLVEELESLTVVDDRNEKLSDFCEYSQKGGDVLVDEGW